MTQRVVLLRAGKVASRLDAVGDPVMLARKFRQGRTSMDLSVQLSQLPHRFEQRPRLRLNATEHRSAVQALENNSAPVPNLNHLVNSGHRQACSVNCLCDPVLAFRPESRNPTME